MCENMRSSNIDIIIPVYNTDSYLIERCINSILNQTYTLFRILLVDDGSDTECASTLEKIKGIDPRINVFHKKNGGPSSARNFGLQCSTAMYIAFVDADDQVTPWYLNDAITCLEKHKLDFIIGGNVFEGRRVSNLDYEVEIIMHGRIEDFIPNAISPDLITFGNDGYIGRGPWARLISRDLAMRCFFDETLHIAEDVCWNIDILRNANRVGIRRNIWYIYSNQPISITRSFNPNLLKYVQLGLEAIESRIDKDHVKQYNAFLKRLKDDINLLNCSYFSKLDRNEKRRAEKQIYNLYPWTLLEKPLLDKSSEIKVRLISLLYRTRMILFFYSLRERVKHIKFD